jgi:small subunit ribosomal protein S2
MAQAASIEELLKAGAHFGHLTRRWNPKMKEFIFMQRNGIHVIDLKKTHAHLQETLDAIGKVARSGKKILFVGTKKQAQEIIKNEATRCGMPYVTHRWLGGMLTNFSTVRKSIARMEEINKMRIDGTYENITKKERLMLDREYEKLEKVMGGISNMGRTPGAIFVVDIVKEDIAINEAMKLNIPIFAIVDTNCDPDIPDYIIPANDDAAKAIHLITANVADAIIEGAAEREVFEEEQAVLEAMEKKSGDTVVEDESTENTRRRRRKGSAGGAGGGGSAPRGPRRSDS